MTKLQGLLQNKTSLWHWAFCGIDQQNNAVNHFENTLYLTGEIGVSWGIYNIDFGVLIMYGRIFCKNGNAALTLNGIRVHNALLNYLILAECTCLLEHLVNQRCLTVVNVRNDCNIS